MKISTKGRYALRMVCELARADGKCISLKGISSTQNISKKYLEQIVPMLTSNGILRTSRGMSGGYSLARPANKLTVGDVLRATEGTLAPVACLECKPNDCPRASECETLFIWEGLFKVMNEYLDNITIQNIIDRNSDLNADNYSI